MSKSAAQTRPKWRDVLKIHPAADLFPMLTDAELRELADDIEAHGLHEKIKIIMQNRRRPDGSYEVDEYDHVVIDGRSRLDALELAGFPIFYCGSILPNLEYIDVVDDLETDTEVVAYVIGANIRRRHLTSEQKRDLVAKLLKTNPEQSNRQTAKIVGVDDKTAASVRRELEATAEIPQLKTRTGKDGKVRPATSTVRDAKRLERFRHSIFYIAAACDDVDEKVTLPQHLSTDEAAIVAEDVKFLRKSAAAVRRLIRKIEGLLAEAATIDPPTETNTKAEATPPDTLHDGVMPDIPACLDRRPKAQAIAAADKVKAEAR